MMIGTTQPACFPTLRARLVVHPKKPDVAVGLLCLLVALFAAGSARAQFPGADRGDGSKGGPYKKTVGIVPNVCTNDSYLEVASGTTVYYCYQLFSPPPFDYSYNVTDDVLGFIEAGSGSANETTTVFASTQISSTVTNIGEFVVQDTSGFNGTRGNEINGTYTFYDNATVVVGTGSGGGGAGGGGTQFDPAIPTLSEYALFAFGALLMVGAAVMLRRNSG